MERRFGAADRHLREAGVTYRAPGEIADRLWPLSHLPLLIDEADWQQLSDGIAQRAQLLELVLRDLYGEGRLVADGAVPAAAIAGSSEYLRPVCGVKPPGGRFLGLYAADVGRGPQVHAARHRQKDRTSRHEPFWFDEPGPVRTDAHDRVVVERRLRRLARRLRQHGEQEYRRGEPGPAHLVSSVAVVVVVFDVDVSVDVPPTGGGGGGVGGAGGVVQLVTGEPF